MAFERLTRRIIGRRPATAAPDPARLRRDVRVAGRELIRLQQRLQLVERRLAQLRALGDDEEESRGLDELVAAFDADLTARHVRQAVLDAPLLTLPVPHLLVRGIWPSAVHEAIARTIPEPALFDGGGDAPLHLTLPLRLAPLGSMVVWAFVNDFVREVLGPALAGRFDAVLPGAAGVSISSSVLRCRLPGDGGAPGPHPPGRLLSTLIDLNGENGGEGYGSQLLVQGTPSIALPFAPNSAVAALAPAAGGYLPIPAGEGVRRVTLELSHLLPGEKSPGFHPDIHAR